MASHEPAYDMHVTFSKYSFAVGKKKVFHPFLDAPPYGPKGRVGEIREIKINPLYEWFPTSLRFHRAPSRIFILRNPP